MALRIRFLNTILCGLMLAASTVHADDRLTKEPQFEVLSAGPIFESQPGHWDAKIRERGWVMNDGGQWKMWYTGYDPEVQPLTMKLGYATSADGITWIRHPQNPLVDQFWVEDMMVVRDGKRLLMFAEGQDDQAQLLASSDGLKWTRIGTLDVRLTNGQPIPPGPFGTPTAFFEDGVWNLFYERRDAGIWLARSSDLKVWTNVSDAPIITPGPDDYDSLMIAMNQVIKLDGKYLAVMHGTGSPQKPRQWSTTIAESNDLIHWTKSPANPLRPISENKSSGLLVPVGSGWRLYTMHEAVHVHQLKP